MADETIPGATAPQTVAAAPAATVPVESTVSTSAALSPDVASASPAAAPVVVPETTALGAEPAPEPAKTDKPADAPAEKTVEPVVEEPAETPKEGDPSAEAQLPTFEPFTLPENVTLDKERLETFTKELGEFEKLTKAPHAEVQAFAQKLVDRHIAETTDALKRQQEYYTTAFEKQKTGWKDDFQKDPEIGGAKQDTTIKGAVDFINKFGGTKEQQTELRTFFNATGVGNHPALIRLISNANASISQLTQEGVKMLPAKAPAAQARSKVATRYGKT